jgi:two-component system, chemotaxis family, sensor kinase Cph1
MNSTLEELTRQCEQEPLAHCGSIQPHGLLLFITQENGKIAAVSKNCQQLTGQAVQDIVGRDGRTWLCEMGVAHIVFPDIPGKRLEIHSPFKWETGEADLLVIAKQMGWLVEIEPLVTKTFDSALLRRLHTQLMRVPDSEAALAALQNDLVVAIQALTGFDRVMLYRFHRDWSGEVIAEAISGSYGSYLGLRFPASDIPAIARQLYLQNPYRHIPSVAADPVALVGEMDVDLTLSELRAVSPVHIQYLKNMQVGASFSISVVQAGRLWGLIACHHHQSLNLSRLIRNRCAETAKGFVLALGAYHANQRVGMNDEIHGRISALVDKISNSPDFFGAVEKHNKLLLDLPRATGGALLFRERAIRLGETPDDEWLAAIDEWFMTQSAELIYSTDHLAEILPTVAEVAPTASGLLAIRIKSPETGGWVRFYWFRGEEVGEVAWAGNPSKPVEVSSQGIRFSPRYSFEKWVEIRRGYATPWESQDILAATLLRSNFLRLV